MGLWRTSGVVTPWHRFQLCPTCSAVTGSPCTRTNGVGRSLTLAHKGRHRVRREPRPLTELHPGLLEKLGVQSDASLGREYGLSRERIRQFRGMHQIAKYQREVPDG